MKRVFGLTAGAALALLTGCVTLSVYPYYTAKDVQFDPALLGVWTDSTQTDSRESWSFEKINDRTYRLTITDSDKRTEFEAHLFKLKGHTFLDCLALERMEYSVSCHILVRVDRTQPTLEMRPLSYEWLGNLLENQPKALRHTAVSKSTPPKGEERKTVVLTAETAELQKFILKHIDTKDAWKDLIVMRRK